ncbi:MAG: phospho-N-acetylmuramoyl-pentapeptide-transferase [Actinomycetota bacterium]|nr:phospho-N-acetylmuramoyl-pentapeptide-transferase [Actinomycetota bacterium]
MIALFIAGAIAFFTALIGSGVLARTLRARGRSQPILELNADNIAVPQHQHKAGTPTMGGLAVLAGALAGYLLSHIRKGVVFSDQTLVMWVGVLAMAGIGFVDDFIKVRLKRNRGVLWKLKGVITLLVAIGIAAALVATSDIDTRLSFTNAATPGWEMGPLLWVLWAGCIIFATTNAVNITDGLDGLASGAAMFGFIAFGVIAFVGFRNPEQYPAIVNPYDLAVFAVAFAGGCAGFLWWNAAPARIFMGDVGALGLGAALALLALATNTQLLLPLLCGLNVLEIGSVAIQMAVFKASGGRRRVFRLSPVHHHFEMVGWPETTVIIRFWLIAAALVMAGMGLFIADFTRLVAP